jgi:tRNA A-37 threonylcarbamoyl transferase component Bud32
MAFTDPLIGRQLGDYRIIDLLGRGGMARVYRGYDEQLDRYAAVKVIDAGLLSGELEDDYRERFQREARAIARLNHPCIVGIYQFGEYDSLYYMAMGFIEGRDLGQILREQHGVLLTPAQIVRIIHDTASALDYAHSQGVIHRDIKPSNIMVTADGRAVLTDFGLALSVPEGSLGNTFGSAHYIAPEQAISSANAVPQSDLYALGVVLYQMLTGRVPFEDASAMSVALKHVSEPPPPPRLYNPSLPPEVEGVVLRALEKEPEDRFPNGDAFARSLEMAFGISLLSDSLLVPPSAQAEAGMNADEAGTVIFTAWDHAPAEAPAAAPAADVHQTKPSAPGRPALSEPVAPSAQNAAAPAARPRSRRWIAVMAIVLIAALPLAILVSRGEGRLFATAGLLDTPTGIPTGMLEASETPAVLAAITSVPSLTATASPAPTATATATATATVPPTATATAVVPPTATAALTSPTSPAALIVANENGAIAASTPEVASAETGAGNTLLLYDGQSLTLINRSERFIDAGALLFVQTRADGAPLTFRSEQWSGGTRSIYMLPPGDCFQVWQLDLPELPVPAGCMVRHAWRAVAFTRWFWIGDPAASFEVRRGDSVLAICRIGAGRCAFDLPERD